MNKTWDNRQDPVWKNAARLYYHCFLKGIQFGSVLGLAVVTPIYFLRTRGKSFQMSKMYKYQMYSVFGGILFALGMCSAKVISWDNRDIKFQDRAYRIHYNQNQNRVDQFVFGGMAAGGALSLLTGGRIPSIIAWASYGAVAAIVTHIATKTQEIKNQASESQTQITKKEPIVQK